MYSVPSTSSILERVIRTMLPEKYHPREKAGMIKCCQSKKLSPLPMAGNQPNPTANNMISSRPTKKLGTERPRRAKILPKLSHWVLTFMADNIPSGIPRTMDMRKPAIPSLIELGRRARYISLTARDFSKEWPMSP